MQDDSLRRLKQRLLASKDNPQNMLAEIDRLQAEVSKYKAEATVALSFVERVNTLEGNVADLCGIVKGMREAMRECASNDKLHASVRFLADTLAINLRGVATTPVHKGPTVVDESPSQHEADDVADLITAATNLAEAVYPNSTATVTQRIRAMTTVHPDRLSPSWRYLYDNALTAIMEDDRG